MTTNLAFSNGSIVLDAGDDLSSADIARQNGQDQRSIGHQNGLSRRYTAGKRRVRAGQLFAISLEGVVGGEDQILSLDEFHLLGTIRKESRTDFRTLGVQQDGYNFETMVEAKPG